LDFAKDCTQDDSRSKIPKQWKLLRAGVLKLLCIATLSKWFQNFATLENFFVCTECTKGGDWSPTPCVCGKGLHHLYDFIFQNLEECSQ
jgi:hypothetical protein